MHVSTVLTKLRRQGAILSDTRPVIRPGLVSVRADADHRLDREAHTRLRLPNRLVLRIVRDVWRTVEELVDAVAAVSPDNAAVLALRVLLDDVAVLAEERAWLHQLNSLFQTLSRRLRHTDGVRVRLCFVANIVCLVQIAVEAAVVEGHVDVQDIAVLQYSLVGYAVADDLVYRRTYRLGEVAVVQRRRI